MEVFRIAEEYGDIFFVPEKNNKWDLTGSVDIPQEEIFILPVMLFVKRKHDCYSFSQEVYIPGTEVFRGIRPNCPHETLWSEDYAFRRDPVVLWVKERPIRQQITALGLIEVPKLFWNYPPSDGWGAFRLFWRGGKWQADNEIIKSLVVENCPKLALFTGEGKLEIPAGSEIVETRGSVISNGVFDAPCPGEGFLLVDSYSSVRNLMEKEPSYGLWVKYP